MEIAVCIDDNFELPCEVMLISLFENNMGSMINVHVLTNDLNKYNRSKLRLVCQKYKQCINFYDIDIDLFFCPLIRGRYTISTYFRILLSDILPNMSKVLYLDSDIIVCDKIIRLWNTDISNYSCAAVVDLQAQSMPSIFKRLQYDMELKYFNAGVLLINLEYWRKHNLKDSILNYIKLNTDRIEIVDQDALNYILRDSKLLLPYRYNVLDSFYRTDCICSKEDEYELLDSITNPVILHFSYRKPWQLFCNHPLKYRFYEYIDRFSLLRYMIKSFTRYDIKYLLSYYLDFWGLNKWYTIFRYKNVA